MPFDSPNWRMANRLTGDRLDEIVAEKQAEGWSWERIARHLHAEHGVEVSRVSLSTWYASPSPTEPDLAAS